MSLLMLPEQESVSWARLLPTGGEGGTAAYQIDASGLSQRNRMMYRSLMPNNNSPAMRTVLRLKSTLIANNPAFEGVAVRHRGFRLTGSVPSTTDQEVWDSDPASKGTRAWYSKQSGTYTDAVFIEPVPVALGIDYVTFELIIRGGGGQVTISNIECRNHYAVPYDLSVLGTQFWTSGFRVDIVGAGADGSTVKRWTRYMRRDQVPIRKGQLVKFLYNGAITGKAFRANSLDPSNAGYVALGMTCDLGFMVKLRRLATDTYDYITLGAKTKVSSDDDEDNPADSYSIAEGSIDIVAEYDYSESDVIAYGQPYRSNLIGNEEIISLSKLVINDIIINMVVSDYISPSQ